MWIGTNKNVAFHVLFFLNQQKPWQYCPQVAQF